MPRSKRSPPRAHTDMLSSNVSKDTGKQVARKTRSAPRASMAELRAFHRVPPREIWQCKSPSPQAARSSSNAPSPSVASSTDMASSVSSRSRSPDGSLRRFRPAAFSDAPFAADDSHQSPVALASRPRSAASCAGSLSTASRSPSPSAAELRAAAKKNFSPPRISPSLKEQLLLSPASASEWVRARTQGLREQAIQLARNTTSSTTSTSNGTTRRWVSPGAFVPSWGDSRPLPDRSPPPVLRASDDRASRESLLEV